MSKLIDKLEIQKTLDIFLPDQLIELRAVGKPTLSGYFKSAQLAAEQVAKYPTTTWYMVMNEINDSCYSREQRDVIIQNPQATTSDNDITYRNWILIDADPNRPSGTSASDEEKQFALETTRKIYMYLKNIGFTEPVVADSGNGYHLLYKIQLDNDEEHKTLIKNFLEALNMYFGDDKVGIDKSVHNASRITKLYGVWTSKGSDTPERSHRKSKLLKIPDDINPTSKVLMQKIADLIPQPEPPSYRNNYNGNAKHSDKFDIKSFIAKHGIAVKQETVWQGNYMYILEHCLFNHEHRDKDAAIIQFPNGALKYKCLHNSCFDKEWQDVRQMFEPDYAKKKYDSTRTNSNFNSSELKTENNGMKQYYQLHEISNIDRSQIVSIPTGIKVLDSKIIGFNKKEVTVISGGNGSGKTTIIGQFILNNINNGFKCTLFSGEMTKERIKTWLHLQAAGRQHTKRSQYGENVYFTPKYIGEKIDNWTKDKLFIHNNLVGLKFSNLLKTVEETVKNEKTDIVYIDNLMAIDISEVNGDKYDKQTNVILEIVRIAKEFDIHIVFVCHPRKSTGFLRKSDISGTADLTNAVDNVIMCHRVNRDFISTSADFFDKILIAEFLQKGYTNCIEMMKNRDLGYQDELIGLYFEPESKRMLNERFENINYGWQDNLQEEQWITININDSIDDVFKEAF